MPSDHHQIAIFLNDLQHKSKSDVFQLWVSSLSAPVWCDVLPIYRLTGFFFHYSNK